MFSTADSHKVFISIENCSCISIKNGKSHISTSSRYGLDDRHRNLPNHLFFFSLQKSQNVFVNLNDMHSVCVGSVPKQELFFQLIAFLALSFSVSDILLLIL